MEKRAQFLQLILRLLSFLGAVAVLVGLYLWFSTEQIFHMGGLLLMIVGGVFILVVFIADPVINPSGVRGQKKQVRDIKKFSTNTGANLIAHAFEKYIQHYPEAMKRYPERIPTSVEFAKQEGNLYNIIYKGTEYVFRFQSLTPNLKNEDDIDEVLRPPKKARLELFKNGRRRLDMILQEALDSHYLPHWIPESIRYLDFGTGSWLRDIKRLIKDAKKIARYYIWTS